MRGAESQECRRIKGVMEGVKDARAGSRPRISAELKGLVSAAKVVASVASNNGASRGIAGR